jgi:hypothetical protein
MRHMSMSSNKVVNEVVGHVYGGGYNTSDLKQCWQGVETRQWCSLAQIVRSETKSNSALVQP